MTLQNILPNSTDTPAVRGNADSPVYISDIIITSKTTTPVKYTLGEFGFDQVADHPENRLLDCIAEITNIAAKEHLANNFDENGKMLDHRVHHITRAVTTEFLFYTKTPLSRAEFDWLQTKIKELAAKQPENLQLVLCSFAVRTNENSVANVSLHVECGAKPKLGIVAKQTSSSIDPVYSNRNQHGMMEPSEHDGFFYDGHQIIECETMGGALWATCIDICLDHKNLPALNDLHYEIKQLTSSDNIYPIQCSHIVSSNCIQLHPDHFVGQVVTHADPYYYSKGKCTLSKIEEISPVFGSPLALIISTPAACSLLPIDAYRQVAQASNTNRLLNHIVESLLAIQQLSHVDVMQKRNMALNMAYHSIPYLSSIQECTALFNNMAEWINQEHSAGVCYLKAAESEQNHYCDQFEHIFHHLIRHAMDLLQTGNENYENYIQLQKAAKRFSPLLADMTRRAKSNRLIEKSILDEDLQALEQLLINGADPNTFLSNALTPLIFAIENDEVEHINMLLNHGADVKLAAQSQSPLLAAYLNDSPNMIDIMKQLILKGANLASETINGQPLLQNVIERQDVDVLRLFQNCTLVPDDALAEMTNLRLSQELCKAIVEHKIEDVKNYLELGADPNITFEKLTLSSLAIHEGIPEILLLLIEYGANINAKIGEGVTPLEMAIIKDNQPMLEILLQNNAKSTQQAYDFAIASKQKNILLLLNNYELKNAIISNDLRKISGLLSQKADPNYRYLAGFTPLMYAVQAGSIETAQLLIKHGADLNIQNDKGISALMQAADQSKLALVKLLLAHHADISLKDSQQRTVMHYAQGKQEIADLFNSPRTKLTFLDDKNTIKKTIRKSISTKKTPKPPTK